MLICLLICGKMSKNEKSLYLLQGCPDPVLGGRIQMGFQSDAWTAFTWDPTLLDESIFCLVGQKTWLDRGWVPLNSASTL